MTAEPGADESAAASGVTGERARQDAHFRALVQHAADMIVVLDADGVLQYVSPSGEQFTGFDPAAAVGTHFLEWVHPDDRERLSDAFRWVVARLGTPQPIEFRLRRRDGAWRAMEATATNLLDHPAVHGVIQHVRDITARARADERSRFLADVTVQLARSLDTEETIATVVNLAVPTLADVCMLHLVDDDGVLRLRAVSATDPDQAAAARAIAIRYPPALDDHRPMSETIRTGQSRLWREINEADQARIAVDGEHQALLQQLGARSRMMTPTRARGSTSGVLTLSMTTSGRVYDHDDLSLAEDLGQRAALAIDNTRLFAGEQQARAEAELAVRTRNQFLSVITHDLGQPLTTMRMAAQMGRRHLSGRAQLDRDLLDSHFGSIDASVSRMVSMVDELVDLAHGERGRALDLRREPVDLIELARREAAAQQATTHRHQITVTAPPEPLIGEWDQARLTRVVVNLLGNAVKYSPAGGPVQVTITLTTLRDAPAAQLAIQDQGLGIAASDLDAIFEPFYRGENVIDQIKGSGIGLASARQIVSQHGGDITAASVEGQGATFTVRLPLHAPDSLDG